MKSVMHSTCWNNLLWWDVKHDQVYATLEYFHLLKLFDLIFSVSLHVFNVQVVLF